MKTTFLLITFSIFSIAYSQQVDDFKVKTSSDSTFSTKSITEPYLVILFLSSECPFDKNYTERIKQLIVSFPQHYFMTVGNKAFKNISHFKTNKTLQNTFNIKKTPTAIVLKNLPGGFLTLYKGPIDDNAQLPTKVKNDYLRNVLKNPSLQNEERYIPGCVIH